MTWCDCATAGPVFPGIWGECDLVMEQDFLLVLLCFVRLPVCFNLTLQKCLARRISVVRDHFLMTRLKQYIKYSCCAISFVCSNIARAWNAGHMVMLCRGKNMAGSVCFIPYVHSHSVFLSFPVCFFPSLVQWLKHSRKEYCELCKHRFAFTPSK